MTGASTPVSGWTNEAVHARYIRYLKDHHGEIDMPNLLETIAQWSANQTVEALATFSDLAPQLGRIEHRLAEMRHVVEALCK